MPGLIGKKIGMTSLYDEGGNLVPCTVIQAGPCYVTQVKNEKTDGYRAVQLSFDDKKEKRTTQPLKGHFKKAKVKPQKILREIRNFRDEYENKIVLGNTINIDDVFKENDYLAVIATSKGKGFQGVVKRHGFGGVGQSTHGQHNRLRAPGAIGACSFPSRVFKGMKMAGRTGGKRVKVFNLIVKKIIKDKNLIVISGCVPGANNGYVVLQK